MPKKANRYLRYYYQIMTMQSLESRKIYLVYLLAATICILLLLNIFLIYSNSKVIAHNKQQQEKAEKIKVNTLDIIRTVHQIDMGLRAYALIRSPVQLKVTTDGFPRMDSIYSNLEKALISQGFPNEPMERMKDTTAWYFNILSHMIELVHQNKIDEFNAILSKDPGYNLYLAYIDFSKQVSAFEDNIAETASRRYNRALRNSYLLQIALFVLTLPALFYMTYLFNSTATISKELRLAEQKAIQILERQNEELERQVHERTKEILTQNEEISAQNEEISSHNEQLVAQQWEIARQKEALQQRNEEIHEAYKTIEDQHLIISRRNRDLIEEVANQTRDLRETNQELIEKNNRLEQFAFIISHNLRAPMARLLGLASLFNAASDIDEMRQIMGLVLKSTQEFDSVFKDLTLILNVQRSNTEIYQDVLFNEIYGKIKNIMEPEIVSTNAEIVTDFSDAPKIHSLPMYLESILYNLINNALKYRDPTRNPYIKVISRRGPDNKISLSVSDNGLGLDVEQFKNMIFTLYRRFHFHVEGKGLGLYLVRTQVEALGGRIEVRGWPGIGSEFIVTLPG